MKKHIIFVVSDGTGETAEKAVRAVLIQYPQINVQIIRYNMVRSVHQVNAIVEEAQKRGAILVYTMVVESVRQCFRDAVTDKGLRAVDLLGGVLDLFSDFFENRPELKPGLLHQVNDEYFKRIEAMEFTVKHDDGSSVENIKNADLVLVGVSRTSKTPLSIYLSHKGYKVANVPLVRGIEPPKELFEVDPKKVFALIINPEILSNIRRERLVRMGQGAEGDYCSLKLVQEEIDWARHIFDRNKRWMVIDVTNKALEETAADIERCLMRKFSLSDLLQEE